METSDAEAVGLHAAAAAVAVGLHMAAAAVVEAKAVGLHVAAAAVAVGLHMAACSTLAGSGFAAAGIAPTMPALSNSAPRWYYPRLFTR